MEIEELKDHIFAMLTYLGYAVTDDETEVIAEIVLDYLLLLGMVDLE